MCTVFDDNLKILCRSPEVNNLKAAKPIIISSEFPSSHNSSGESKGGTLLFKFAKQKKAKTIPNKLKVKIYCTF